LTWTAPGDASDGAITRYHVYRRDPVTRLWTLIAELTPQTTSYAVSVGGDGNNWQYKVTAMIK
jgi:fibronectin type 3 domain-containing protein